MKRQKKAAVLVCILLTVLNTTACGQGEKDENVPIEEPAASQQENDAQAEGDSDSEMMDDISGTYGWPDDDSTLSISAGADGFYHAEVLLFRLTTIDDFMGKYENGILAMTGTDAAGDPIAVEITFSDRQATLTFTDSTWEYLENGTQYVFDKE
ncbi:MAG: hypothetical protein NC409_04800 [Clostridium sp.]|nr:hypothetical protein [Clostridium sp.]